MSSPIKHRWSISHNYLAGITFGVWMKLLAQNKFWVSPLYWHRGILVTLISVVNSFFAVIEKLRFDREIQQTEVTNPPVFILGHWRSGTTLLHDLLAQDDAQFQFANTYQVVNPLTFLTTENFASKMFAGLLPDTRPMDNMKMKFSAPQEDEFMMTLMTLHSVYLGISFPKRTAEYEKYLSFRGVARKEIEEWKTAFHYVCKKLSLGDERALLIKSPPHTARVRTILELFPDAKFIHIHRDPYRVFQSQRHFFDTVCWHTYMQRPDIDQIDEGILQRHETMYDAYFEDLSLIPEGNFCELSFDALETDPVSEVRRIYQTLSLADYDAFAPKLKEYVNSIAGYRKNDFVNLDADTRAVVAKRWKRSFDTWGYSTD